MEHLFMFVCILVWFAVGFLAWSIGNAFIRDEFKVLYIENYFGTEFGKEFGTESGSRIAPEDLFMMFFSMMFGVASLISLVLLMLLRVFEYRGMSTKLSKWTQEEAKVLFPDGYTFEVAVRTRHLKLYK